MPLIKLSNVVFPAPFGPMIEEIEPRLTQKLTSSMASSPGTGAGANGSPEGVMDVYEAMRTTFAAREFTDEPLPEMSKNRQGELTALTSPRFGAALKARMEEWRPRMRRLIESGHQGQEVFINLRTGKVVVVLGWRAALRNKSHQPDSVTEWLVR